MSEDVPVYRYMAVMPDGTWGVEERPETPEQRAYREVYAQDSPITAGGWIQWKGTNVCMDTQCSCGFSGHIDADFCYFVQCPECGQKYAVGQHVKFIPITDEQVALLGASTFVSLESDDE